MSSRTDIDTYSVHAKNNVGESSDDYYLVKVKIIFKGNNHTKVLILESTPNY